MKLARKVLVYLAWAALLVNLYVVATLLYGTLTDYQPEEILPVEINPNSAQTEIEDTSLTFAIWNLGYGGLGKESNFFFDHGSIFWSNGKMVRPEKELTMKNLQGITAWIGDHPVDFVFLQEVDFDSKRSYCQNMFKSCGAKLPAYAAGFAPNYKSDRVPIPIFEPWDAYGHVLSGLASYSRFRPSDSRRLQLPGAFPWPTRLFQLDRCILEQRFPLKNGKELVVMNIHNSAYDKSGELKKQQMAFLKKRLEEEYAKGAYIVVGGDWNQCPPGFAFDAFMPGNTQGYTQIEIAPDFMPEGWQWAFDSLTPTNRKIRDVYQPGTTFVTLIDFYLVSPNLEIVSVKTDNLNFEYSDHQPVMLTVKFLQ